MDIDVRVVHVSQLTPDVLRTLAEEGWTIIRNPEVLIFGREKALPADQSGGQEASRDGE